MDKAEIALWLGAAASLVAIIGFLRERQHEAQPSHVMSNGMQMPSVAAPTFIINRNAGASAVSPNILPTYSGSSCGCGGGFGDFAVPRVSPAVGLAQNTLPFGPAAVVEVNPLTLATINNGASA